MIAILPIRDRNSRTLLLPALIGLLLLAGSCNRIVTPEPVEEPRVVILMYHRITAGEPENLYERSAAEFERDLIYLRDNNIRVMDFNELAEVIEGREQLVTHGAIITFDDGDHSWYTRAMPLLKRYRMKATFFLWAAQIGKNSFLSWEEVQLMSNHAYDGGVRPFSFGSHTMSHQFLMSMKEALGGGEVWNEYLDEELGGSKILIDRYIHGVVESLALPYGDGAGDPDVIAAAKRHGYRFIRTSERNVTGTAASDLYRLPSLPLLDDTWQGTIGDYLGIE